MSDDLNLVESHAGGGQVGYGSEFEYDSEADHKRSRRHDLAAAAPVVKTKLPSKQEVTAEYSRDEGIRQRYQILSLDAYGRHKKYINDYLFFFGGSREEFKRDTSRDKRDIDIVREHHRFLWQDDDGSEQTWEKRLAKKYYDKLFKEYCIADLSKYKENKVAMRWRIEKEVVSGKGQFICGEKHCQDDSGLRSWEVNFGYTEHGEKRNALVKLRLCSQCSYKLNYRHKRKEIVAKRKNKLDTSERSKKRRSRDRHSETSPDRTGSDKSSAGDSSEAAGDGGSEGASDGGLWSGPAPVVDTKTRGDEFEEYFEDMFL